LKQVVWRRGRRKDEDTEGKELSLSGGGGILHKEERGREGRGGERREDFHKPSF
jgi:hypothetical protein